MADRRDDYDRRSIAAESRNFGLGGVETHFGSESRGCGTDDLELFQGAIRRRRDRLFLASRLASQISASICACCGIGLWRFIEQFAGDTEFPGRLVLFGLQIS